MINCKKIISSCLIVFFSVLILVSGLIFAYTNQSVKRDYPLKLQSVSITFKFNDHTHLQIGSDDLNITKGNPVDVDMSVIGETTDKLASKYVLNYHIDLQIVKDETCSSDSNEMLLDAIEVYQYDGFTYRYIGMLSDFEQDGLHFDGTSRLNIENNEYLRFVYSSESNSAYDEIAFLGGFTIKGTANGEIENFTDKIYVESSNGTTNFDEIFESADSVGKTVVLTSDVVVNKNLTSKGKIGIDLNGHNLDLNNKIVKISYNNDSNSLSICNNSKNTNDVSIKNGKLLIEGDDLYLIDPRYEDGVRVVNAKITGFNETEYNKIFTELKKLLEERFKQTNDLALFKPDDDLSFIYQDINYYFDSNNSSFVIDNLVDSNSVLSINKDSLGKIDQIVIKPVTNTDKHLFIFNLYSIDVPADATQISGYINLRGSSLQSIANELIKNIPDVINHSLFLKSYDPSSDVQLEWMIVDGYNGEILDSNGIYRKNGISKLIELKENNSKIPLDGVIPCDIYVKLSKGEEQYTLCVSKNIDLMSPEELSEYAYDIRNIELVFENSEDNLDVYDTYDVLEHYKTDAEKLGLESVDIEIDPDYITDNLNRLVEIENNVIKLKENPGKNQVVECRVILTFHFENGKTFIKNVSMVIVGSEGMVSKYNVTYQLQTKFSINDYVNGALSYEFFGYGGLATKSSEDGDFDEVRIDYKTLQAVDSRYLSFIYDYHSIYKEVLDNSNLSSGNIYYIKDLNGHYVEEDDLNLDTVYYLRDNVDANVSYYEYKNNDYKFVSSEEVLNRNDDGSFNEFYTYDVICEVLPKKITTSVEKNVPITATIYSIFHFESDTPNSEELKKLFLKYNSNGYYEETGNLLKIYLEHKNGYSYFVDQNGTLLHFDTTNSSGNKWHNFPLRVTLKVQGYYQNEQSSIADRNLYTILVDCFDSNGDNLVSTSESSMSFEEVLENLTNKGLYSKYVKEYINGGQNIKYLDFSYENLQMPISSLKGIEYFNNITGISFAGVGLYEINNLSELTKLKYLNLGGCNSFDGEHKNYIADISSLKFDDDLIYLNVSKNNISDLEPLHYLKSLAYLDISHNNIQDFNSLDDLTTLKELNLSGIKINTYYLTAHEGARYSLALIKGNNPSIVFRYDNTITVSNEQIVAAKAIHDLEEVLRMQKILYLPTTYYYDGKTYSLNWMNGIESEKEILDIQPANPSLPSQDYVVHSPLFDTAVSIMVEARSGSNNFSQRRVFNITVEPSSEEDIKAYIYNRDLSIEYGFPVYVEATSYVKDIKLLSCIFNNFNKVTNDNEIAVKLYSNGQLSDITVNDKTSITINDYDYNETSYTESFNFSNKSICDLTGIDILNGWTINNLDLSVNAFNELTELRKLQTLYGLVLGGQEFDFSELYTVFFDEDGMLERDIEPGVQDVKVRSENSLTNLRTLDVSLCYNKTNYEALKQLYILYLLNTNVTLYVSDSNTSWNPYSSSIAHTGMNMEKAISSLKSVIPFALTQTYNVGNIDEALSVTYDSKEIDKCYFSFIFFDIYQVNEFIIDASLAESQYIHKAKVANDTVTIDDAKYYSLVDNLLTYSTYYYWSESAYLKLCLNGYDSHGKIIPQAGDPEYDLYGKTGDYYIQLNAIDISSKIFVHGTLDFDLWCNSTYGTSFQTDGAALSNNKNLYDMISASELRKHAVDSIMTNIVFGSNKIELNSVDELMNYSGSKYPYYEDIYGNYHITIDELQNPNIVATKFFNFTAKNIVLPNQISSITEHGNITDGWHYFTQIKQFYTHNDGRLLNGNELINLEKFYYSNGIFDITQLDCDLPNLVELVIGYTDGAAYGFYANAEATSHLINLEGLEVQNLSGPKDKINTNNYSFMEGFIHGRTLNSEGYVTNYGTTNLKKIKWNSSTNWTILSYDSAVYIRNLYLAALNSGFNRADISYRLGSPLAKNNANLFTLQPYAIGELPDGIDKDNLLVIEKTEKYNNVNNSKLFFCDSSVMGAISQQVPSSDSLYNNNLSLIWRDTSYNTPYYSDHDNSATAINMINQFSDFGLQINTLGNYWIDLEEDSNFEVAKNTTFILPKTTGEVAYRIGYGADVYKHDFPIDWYYLYNESTTLKIVHSNKTKISTNYNDCNYSFQPNKDCYLLLIGIVGNATGYTAVNKAFIYEFKVGAGDSLYTSIPDKLTRMIVFRNHKTDNTFNLTTLTVEGDQKIESFYNGILSTWKKVAIPDSTYEVISSMAKPVRMYSIEGIDNFSTICTKLTILTIKKQRIDSISPVSKLTKLTTLTVNNTLISEIPDLKNCKVLSKIDLKYNPLLTLSGIDSKFYGKVLTDLNLAGTPAIYDKDIFRFYTDLTTAKGGNITFSRPDSVDGSGTVTPDRTKVSKIDLLLKNISGVEVIADGRGFNLKYTYGGVTETKTFNASREITNVSINGLAYTFRCPMIELFQNKKIVGEWKINVLITCTGQTNTLVNYPLDATYKDPNYTGNYTCNGIDVKDLDSGLMLFLFKNNNLSFNDTNKTITSTTPTISVDNARSLTATNLNYCGVKDVVLSLNDSVLTVTSSVGGPSVKISGFTLVKTIESNGYPLLPYLSSGLSNVPSSMETLYQSFVPELSYKINRSFSGDQYIFTTDANGSREFEIYNYRYGRVLNDYVMVMPQTISYYGQDYPISYIKGGSTSNINSYVQIDNNIITLNATNFYPEHINGTMKLKMVINLGFGTKTIEFSMTIRENVETYNESLILIEVEKQDDVYVINDKNGELIGEYVFDESEIIECAYSSSKMTYKVNGCVPGDEIHYFVSATSFMDGRMLARIIENYGTFFQQVYSISADGIDGNCGYYLSTDYRLRFELLNLHTNDLSASSGICAIDGIDIFSSCEYLYFNTGLFANIDPLKNLHLKQFVYYNTGYQNTVVNDFTPLLEGSKDTLEIFVYNGQGSAQITNLSFLMDLTALKQVFLSTTSFNGTAAKPINFLASGAYYKTSSFEYILNKLYENNVEVYVSKMNIDEYNLNYGEMYTGRTAYGYKTSGAPYIYYSNGTKNANAYSITTANGHIDHVEPTIQLGDETSSDIKPEYSVYRLIPSAKAIHAAENLDRLVCDHETASLSTSGLNVYYSSSNVTDNVVTAYLPASIVDKGMFTFVDWIASSNNVNVKGYVLMSNTLNSITCDGETYNFKDGNGKYIYYQEEDVKKILDSTEYYSLQKSKEVNLYCEVEIDTYNINKIDSCNFSLINMKIVIDSFSYERMFEISFINNN